MATKKTKAYTRTYILKEGDTMHSLALDFYGDVSKWRLIADVNGIKDVRKIKPGQKIRY